MYVVIVAEIGINHNGDMSICKRLIDMAVESGCDAVKFQKRDLDQVYTQEFLDSSRESPWGTTQREQKAGNNGYISWPPVDVDFSRYSSSPRRIRTCCNGRSLSF